MIFDFFATRYSWRDFLQMMDDGGGGGGDSTGFPYGPADRNTNSPGSPEPPHSNNSPPAGRGYNPGPAPHRKPPPQAPPDPWAGVPGAVHDQAIALVEKFLAAAGWPMDKNANDLALKLAKSGVNITGSPFDAYDWLFGNGFSDEQRANNPWAQFGMLKDDYNQTVSKLNSVMFDWTGDQLDAGVMKNAIRGGWTPDQIRNFAMYGNASGTGQLLDAAQLSGDMPWLSEGQTYSSTLQGFQAFEGHAPTDKATLGAWFRFGVSAKHVGAGQEAVATPAKALLTGTEVR